MDYDLDLSLLDLPLPEFLEGYGAFLDDNWDPSITDDWLFHLVRGVKAHPATRTLRPDEAYARVVDAARRQEIEQLLELGLDDEDGEVAFHSMWQRVRFPLGTDPVEAACLVAGNGVIRSTTHPGRYERFLTVAALIQIQVRRRPILLPVRKVAKHFTCEPNTVTSWTGWAVDEGVLIKVAEHEFRSQGHSRAAEYVFGLHFWKKDGHDALAKLLGIPVRPADVQWTAEQFSEPR